MIEEREDGSLEGEPKRGRVYKMAGDGKVWFALWLGELDTDLPPYIEQYDGFRGWQTDFLPLAKADAQYQALMRAGVSKEEVEVEQVKHLKAQFFKAREAAEKAAYAYFSACPVGEERIWASEVYENIRNATRV